MIDPVSISEIVATYEKHGWILRRVLLSAGPERDSLARHFEGTPVAASAVDAAWFSRPPTSGCVAWELRYLGNIPFALLESVDENDADFERALKSVEERLCDTIRAKISA